YITYEYTNKCNNIYVIISAKMPYIYYSLSIKNIYKNCTNAKDVNLDFFISFEDMISNLLDLINKCFFEVRLAASKEILNKNTKNLKERLYTFAEKTGKRKKRMSQNEVKHHIIHIRIAKDLVSKDQI